MAGSGPGEPWFSSFTPPARDDASSPSAPQLPDQAIENTDAKLPTITLPKGGGAIRGIGEKLTIDQPTGTARLSVPVFTSPGRQGFGPQLALSYDSGAGNGPFGIGWSLAVPAITRKTSEGLPRYEDSDDSDVFVLLGVEDLVPLLIQSGDDWAPQELTYSLGASTFAVRRYRPRVEAGFARIERWQDTASGEVHWRTVSKLNVTSVYGEDATSRIADPEDPTRVFSWLLALSFDDRGNAISYQYKAEDASNVPSTASELGRAITANRYLKRIFYGNRTPYGGVGELPSDWCFQVVVDYGEHDQSAPSTAETASWPCRPDPFSVYRAGFELRTYRTCRRVLMFHQFPAELGTDAVVVRSTDLAYAAAAPDPQLPRYTLLSSVTQTGWRANGAQSFETAQLPPLSFGYSALAIDDTLKTADPESLANLQGDIDGSRRRWIDLLGEGLQGILTEDDGAWYYKQNLSAWDPAGDGPAARFAPLRQVATKPKLTARDRDLELTSLNGDGRLCAVNFATPLAGWFELGEQQTWEPLRSFAATAEIDWSSHNLRFVDLDGDGLADVLITEDEVLTWYRWILDTGFAAPAWVRKPLDEDRGPAVLFADGTDSVALADMSGDGLSDLVRIRNGEVCYWPNLGYGRFGAKIAMDGAPLFDYPDRFDVRRVRLADIDGSGTADLVYLGSDATTVYFNQSGNSWTQGRALAQFPPVDDVAQASVFDLLGTGTAAAVWSSPLPADAGDPLRYVDLTSSTKPYLLDAVSNNLGASTTLSYAPSTQFYLEDQAAGNPWLTRLPFPVHVVARARTTEAISATSIVSSYSYHHGFYDGVEREFRGFARVDQLDAEAIPSDSGIGRFTATPTVSDQQFALAPVWTRTWYHTGAFLGSQDIAARLALEYYQGDAQAPQLQESVLAPDAGAEERREASRALRGRVLRQEVYAHDGMPAAVNPYTTAQHRYQVDRLQPPAGVSYGAYHAWELESVAVQYEREPSDPRVTHQLTLAVDGYGNVTSSASVGYPRRVPQFAEQAATSVLYGEADYTNVDGERDWYRLGVPVETRSFELTGVAPTRADGLFDPVSLRAAAAAAATISYEGAPGGTVPQRRLLQRSRTIYRGDDLSASLPIGQVESLALVDRSYQLAFTPGLLQRIFVASSKLTAAELSAQLAGPGEFVDLDSDGNRWTPSSRTLYSPDPSSPSASFAQQHFYLPQSAVDPWGNVSAVAYDDHDLLLIDSTDPLGNVLKAEQNYRVLSSWLATDMNLNRTGVRFDPLGMVIAVAAMGKALPGGVDEGDHLDTTTAEPSPSDDPTARLAYDLSAYQSWASDPASDPAHPAPAWVRTVSRVRHKDPTTPWLESYLYTDGLGRVALAKAQVEAGAAPQRDASGNLVRDAHGALVYATTATRWVGSGRVVYDNKGNAIKAYESFFDSSPAYDSEADLVQWGVTAISRYDPLSRPIRVDNPDGSYSAVEFGPWESVSSDENDTVLTSAWYASRAAGALGGDEQDAATKAAASAATPTLTYLDPRGRVFQTVADNGAAGKFVTTLTLDIEGRVLVTTDALGRAALTQDYDLLGAEIHRQSIDSGEAWLLTDCAGQLLQAWDSRGFIVTGTYDALRRPLELLVSDDSDTQRVAEQVTYGEGLANAQQLNLRGTVYQHRDGAGLTTTQQCDFDGNMLAAAHQPLVDYVDDVDWSADPALDPQTLTVASTYDALNRVLATTTPDGSVTTPSYNERGLLAAVTVSLRGASAATSVVQSASYDAKGQRQSIAYGNGASSSYVYDPDTFRLRELATTRPGGAGSLQQLAYTYDPVGNITRLIDRAQQTIFFDNQVITPSADYTYDAIYRLIRASGREHVGQSSAPQTGWSDAARVAVPLPSDGQAMRNYTESYAYDELGNFQSLAHSAAGGSWTRTYAYDEPATPPANNRLTSTTVGGTTEHYSYDANGNVVSMPHLSLMQWDWKDQLQATASQIVTDGTPETTYYRYDATGQRVLKATNNHNGARVATRTYFGAYELYREYGADGAVTLERESLNVSDGARRVCLFETTTPAGATPSTLARYQLSNHLDSAVLELDDAAAIITYEEYYPYGSTSFQSGRSAAEVSLKRYRFTARERDSENGFYYHGARYYAPWLARWISPDPAGQVDGPALYNYCRANPLTLSDPGGMQTGDAATDAYCRDWAAQGMIGYGCEPQAPPVGPPRTTPSAPTRQASTTPSHASPAHKQSAPPSPSAHAEPQIPPPPPLAAPAGAATDAAPAATATAPAGSQPAPLSPEAELAVLKAYAEAATAVRYSDTYYRITGVASGVGGAFEIVAGAFTSESGVGVVVLAQGFMTLEAATEQVISGAPQRTLLARGTTAGLSRLGTDPDLAYAAGTGVQVMLDTTMFAFSAGGSGGVGEGGVPAITDQPPPGTGINTGPGFVGKVNCGFCTAAGANAAPMTSSEAASFAGLSEAGAPGLYTNDFGQMLRGMGLGSGSPDVMGATAAQAEAFMRGMPSGTKFGVYHGWATGGAHYVNATVGPLGLYFIDNQRLLGAFRPYFSLPSNANNVYVWTLYSLHW